MDIHSGIYIKCGDRLRRISHFFGVCKYYHGMNFVQIFGLDREAAAEPVTAPEKHLSADAEKRLFLPGKKFKKGVDFEQDARYNV